MLGLPRNKTLHYKRWLQGLGALLVVGGSVFISTKILHSAIRTATYVPTSRQECQKQGSDNFQCYGKYYAQLTYDAGVDAAFQDMQKGYDSDPAIKSQCHQLAHIVGRTAYEKYGSLDTAFQHGNNFCWSGFYHGAVEQAATDLGQAKIRQEAPNICKSFAEKAPYSFDDFNCVHGLGHGLMAVNNYNLPDALKNCDVLKTDWDQSSCYGGVFMENVMVAARGDGTSAWFKADQPLYPCTFVAAKYKEQCYLMQTSYVLQHNGYNFAATFDECGKADAGFIKTCYRSAGRDASGSTVSDVAGTIANCQKAPNHDALYQCMLGAERDFVSYYHGTDKANQLCDAFNDPSITEPCRADVIDYAKSM